MGTFSERLDSLRQKGERKQDFADRIGVHPAVFSRYSKGIIPRSDTVKRICQATGVSPRWLLTGEGPREGPADLVNPVDMATAKIQAEGNPLIPARNTILEPFKDRVASNTPARVREEHGIENLDILDMSQLRQIPVVGISHAGKFIEANDAMFPAGTADEYMLTLDQGERSFGVKVEGDSMEPLFMDGDYLVVNPDLAAQSGDYVIAKNDQGESIIRKLTLTDKYMALKPLNPAYEPIFVTSDSPEQYIIIGKIVARTTVF